MITSFKTIAGIILLGGMLSLTACNSGKPDAADTGGANTGGRLRKPRSFQRLHSRKGVPPRRRARSRLKLAALQQQLRLTQAALLRPLHQRLLSLAQRQMKRRPLRRRS